VLQHQVVTCQMALMLFPAQKFACTADCKKCDECDLLSGTNGAKSRCISSIKESEKQQLRCKATRRAHFSCRFASLRKVGHSGDVLEAYSECCSVRIWDRASAVSI
jgi:hypothetical protein